LKRPPENQAGQPVKTREQGNPDECHVRNAIVHDCAVPARTVTEYTQMLEDLLLARRISPFTRRAHRATVAHQRFFLFHAGVFRSLRRTAPLDHRSEIDGAALEGLVFQHLCAWSDGTVGNPDIHFRRTHTGLEVDFIVFGGGTFLAIDVKNTTRPRHFLGPKDVLAVSVEQFLRDLMPGSGWRKLSNHTNPNYF
jgi:hypothetical protein